MVRLKETKNTENVIQKVCQIDVTSNNDFYGYCQDVCSKACILRNQANYLYRQCFFHGLKNSEDLREEEILFLQSINTAIDKFNDFRNLRNTGGDYKIYQKGIGEKFGNKQLSYYFVDFYFKNYPEFNGESEINPYRQLPVGVSQQVLQRLDHDWKSYYKALADYKFHPEKYLGRPNPPKYNKQGSYVKVTYTKNSAKIRESGIQFQKGIVFPTNCPVKSEELNQVGIVPKNRIFTIEVVYTKPIEPEKELDQRKCIAIDLGVKNFASVVNNIGLAPFIIDGKEILHEMQRFHKERAVLKSKQPLQLIHGEKKQVGDTKKIKDLTRNHQNRVKDYIHKASRQVIDYCVLNNIGLIIIGKNKGWKQEVEMGRRTNQNFVSMPHSQFISLIEYKAQEAGISVELIEESYTSKSSFIDDDPIPSFGDQSKETIEFSGKRKKRGLYCSRDGIEINADINGAANIMRKVHPELSADIQIDKLLLTPRRIKKM